MADFLIPRVAAEARIVGGAHRALRETDDLGHVTAALDVEAAIAVAPLALHSLLLVESVLEVTCGIWVTNRAVFTARAGGPGDGDGGVNPGRASGSFARQHCRRKDDEDRRTE
jgi:hypothetical protein